ncbi:MAG: agarase, partial [Armatimonadetes bacterium]|nr:agarase [Armatimonadota bacterium]
SYYVPEPYELPLRKLHEASGLPLLISEWAFRARDSGLPNTKGAGPLVDTQAQRAAKYREYLTALLRMPFVVGAHWFKYADQPAEGRFDGENSNYGLVTINDEPYAEFVAVVRETNQRAYRTRVGAEE